MEKKERTHEYLCEHVLDEYVTGICNGKRFCFRVDAIKKLTQDGIAISDGEKDGWWVFLLWEELERMFDCEAVGVRAEATHGFYEGHTITECRFVRSDESLAEIITEQEVREARDYAYENVLEEDVQATREFLEAKGLLTDRTEDDEPQDSEPKGRKGGDIVRECREAIENAFSDMIWDLCEHPVRPSLVVEAYEEKGRLLTALGSLEEYYCITEGTEVAK